MTENISLISEFQSAAARYRSAIDAMDVKAVNDNAGQSQRLFHAIQRSPPEPGWLSLLLSDPNESVRLLASAFGLAIDESSCIATLAALAAAGPYKFEAQQCLERWKAGEWTLDLPIPVTQSTTDTIKSPAGVADPIVFATSSSRRVLLGDIVGPDWLDSRIGCVNVYFVNIVGVNSDSVQFCPNSEPPSNDEALAWLWIIRPDLSQFILRKISDEEFANGIRRLATSYEH